MDKTNKCNVVKEKIAQETINTIIWKACDRFRGKVDVYYYKDYVISILFIKYLSDFYKEKLDSLQIKHNNNQERIQKSLSREKFKLDEKSTFEYLFKHKESENLGEKINKILEKIEDENKEKLEGLFRNIDFNNETILGTTQARNKLLKHLLEDFNDKKLDLRPNMLSNKNIIGDSYEKILSHFASELAKKGEDFFTPSIVSSLLAKLVEAKDGDRIYDPTCGSGSLLIETTKEIENNNFRLYAQEINETTVSIAKINMFLHNINDAVIKWGDTINNPLHLENENLKKFDVIVANPPFSLDNWGVKNAKNDKYKRFTRGIPPKSKGDYAFLLHMISSLNQYGRMGVILPLGVLFRGASEGEIRKQLIDENLLDTVIGLPSNLFFGTNIPTCIMVFKKQKSDTDVLFIDASREFNKEKTQNNIDKNHIQKIVDTYKNKKILDKYSYKATFEEIKNNNYNLNIARYIDTFEEEEKVDRKKEIEKIEKELNEIKVQMSRYLQEFEI